MLAPSTARASPTRRIPPSVSIRPLQEPIRLQDLSSTACSRGKKRKFSFRNLAQKSGVVCKSSQVFECMSPCVFESQSPRVSTSSYPTSSSLKSQRLTSKSHFKSQLKNEQSQKCEIVCLYEQLVLDSMWYWPVFWRDSIRTN